MKFEPPYVGCHSFEFGDKKRNCILLAREGGDFYGADMNFMAARRWMFLALIGGFCLTGQAQGLQVDVEEFKRLQGEMADLRDANAAQQKRITELNRRLDNLQEEMKTARQREKLGNEDFVTREALKRVLDQVAEVDAKRESDQKVILEQLDKLRKTLSQPPVTREGNGRNNREKENVRTEPVEAFEGTVIEHPVKEGQAFSVILEDYNKFLKSEGKRPITTAEVKKANPGLDPSRIRAGQKILLPVPDKK